MNDTWKKSTGVKDYLLDTYDAWIASLFNFYPELIQDDSFVDNYLVFRNRVMSRLEKLDYEKERKESGE
jgi:hypothetical protein